MANPWDNDPIVASAPRSATGTQSLGQFGAGNIDLTNRPRVRNPDGSVSTVRSMSAKFDGKEVLLPTVSDDGRIMSDDEAINQYLRTGQNLGSFNSVEEANAYADRLHREQEQMYVGAPAMPWDNDPIVGSAGAPALPAQPPVLRHPDGRLTEAGWDAEIKAMKERQQAELNNSSFLSNLVAGYGRSAPQLLHGVNQLGTDMLAKSADLGAALWGDVGGETLANARRDWAATLNDRSARLRQETADERRFTEGLRDTAGGFIGNLGGDVINTIPLAGVGVAAKGATAAKAIGQAALGGAAQGAIQPVATEGERLGNATLGAAFGGGIAGLGRGAMRVAEEVLPSNFLARTMNYFGERANRQPYAQESEALAARTGIDFTPGMVSGGKAQTAMENMARQSVFSADTAFKADERIANQAVQYVRRVMDRISRDNLSPQSIGEGIQKTVREAVEKIATSREQMAARQFGAIRNLVGDKPVVDYSATKKALNDIIGEYGDVIGSDAGKIRAQAQSLLDEIVQKGEGVSLDAARRARGFYGAAARGKSNLFENVSPDLNRRLAAKMYGAISDDLDAAAGRIDELAGFGQNMPVQEGVQAMRPSELLKQANDDYRRHSQLLEAVKNSPLKRLLGDEFNVDDFMTVNTLAPETVIQRMGSMKPTELNLVRDFMEKNAPDTWQQYKRMLLDDALSAAETVPASGGANSLPFNASGFIRAIGGDKPEKIERLRAIFNPKEMSEVLDAMQAARRMGDKFGANFSGTGPYNEVMQASRGFVDAIKGASVRALAGAASPMIGLNSVARMMLNADGRRALIELSKVPPGTKRANDLAAYLASVAAVSTRDQAPLEIDISGGTPGAAPTEQEVQALRARSAGQ